MRKWEEALESATSALETMAVDTSYWQVRDELATLRFVINRLELCFARRAAALDEAQTNSGDSAYEYLRGVCRMSAHATNTAIAVGHHEGALPRSVAAVGDGTIGFAHLGWIALTARRLHNVGVDAAALDEAKLLRRADTLSVAGMRMRCDNQVHALDREEFVKAEVDQVEVRSLELHTLEDGGLRLNGYLDREGSAIVRTAIEPFISGFANDQRPIDKRNADALVEACSALLDSGQVPQRGGVRPHISLTVTLESLLGLRGTEAAELETGSLISSMAAQRLACDATLTRILFGSNSQPIDVGRSQRVVPPATRRALVARDQHCAWPHCNRRAAYTQAHHIVHWVDGGATNLDNLVLLCRRHHWAVHELGYTITRDDTGNLLVVAPLERQARAPTFAA